MKTTWDFKPRGRNFTYLNHVIFLVELLDGGTLSQFEQRDFRRNQPAKEIAEDPVVAERNDVLNFPENRPMKEYFKFASLKTSFVSF